MEYMNVRVFHPLSSGDHNNTSASLTKATNGVGIGLSLQLDAGLLWLAFLVITQPVTLDSHRLYGGLPACHNRSAVKRLELKNRS